MDAGEENLSTRIFLRRFSSRDLKPTSTSPPQLLHAGSQGSSSKVPEFSSVEGGPTKSADSKILDEPVLPTEVHQVDKTRLLRTFQNTSYCSRKLQIFQTEGATIRAVLTPGHTTDNVSFILEEEKGLFSGDCVLGCGTAVFDDLREYLRSLRKLLQKEEILHIYPGIDSSNSRFEKNFQNRTSLRCADHGPLVTDDYTRITEYILHRQK